MEGQPHARHTYRLAQALSHLLADPLNLVRGTSRSTEAAMPFWRDSRTGRQAPTPSKPPTAAIAITTEPAAAPFSQLQRLRRFFRGQHPPRSPMARLSRVSNLTLLPAESRALLHTLLRPGPSCWLERKPFPSRLRRPIRATTRLKRRRSPWSSIKRPSL